MRTLTNAEVQFTAGANACAVFTGIVLTTAAITSILASMELKCYFEPYTYEIKTPVYDAYGNFAYNIVDVYEDRRWTCR